MFHLYRFNLHVNEEACHRKYWVNYMKKTLDKALAKAQEEVFPQMDRVASAPITPEMLAQQAAALGFDLVPKKVKKSVKKA